MKEPVPNIPPPVQHEVHETDAERRARIVQNAAAHMLTHREYAYKAAEFPPGYTVHFESDGRHIIAFAADHSNALDNPELKDIERIIETEQPDVIFVEGIDGLNTPAARTHLTTNRMPRLNFAEAVRYGEPFATFWLAQQRGIRVESPELSDEKLYEQLISQSLSKEAIALHRLISELGQYVQHHESEPVEHYLDRTRERLKTSLGIESDASLFDFVEHLARHKGIDFDRTNWQEKDRAHNLVDPVPWEGKVLHGTNRVAAARSVLRDTEILARTYDELEHGARKIFIVYGASHIHMLAPALERLLQSFAKEA